MRFCRDNYCELFAIVSIPINFAKILKVKPLLYSSLQYLIPQYPPMKDNKNYDAIIIGGSYAGLSAAMALGRSLRKILIIDSGLPCNRQTPHSHNFITQDGKTPAAIATTAKEQVLKYDTVSFFEGLASFGRKTETGFEITTKSGEVFNAKKLIFSTGISDIMPDITGFAECWGISVVHCPYCHGYEIRNKKTGIMANGHKAFHLASLVKNLSDSITILTSGKADFDEDQLTKLHKHNIKIIEKEISGIKHENGSLERILFNDGSSEDFDAAYATIPFQQHSNIPGALGCDLNEQGYIQVDSMQKTTVPGIYACGDNCSPLRSVANAVYAGNIAGAVLNMELTQETF